MTDIPRVIIYAKPDELILAAKVAASLQAPGYEWPADGITIFQCSGSRDLMFAARRNKSGFTIYSQQIGK